ncbi:MAG TPA: FHA domain-containing protein, partial [Thermoanaerobaculia bacterium]|nr:FHA domain-containing protein [Thermoanaerobaculia bacterium]
SLQHFSAAELLLLLARQAHTGTFDADGSAGRARLAFRKGRLVWTDGDPAEAIAKLVARRDGTFTFLDEVALPENAKAIDVDIVPIVEEARQLQQLYPDPSIVFRVVNRPAMEGEISLRPDEFQILFHFSGGRSLTDALQAAKRPASELFPIVRKLETAGLIELVAPDPDATARLAPEPAPAAPKKSTAPSAPIGTLTGDDGSMHPLLEEQVTIGRVRGNDIILEDASISSKHARIVRTADGFAIEDSGSRNGTFVNSDSVTAPRLLADGDIVRLGKVLLTFNLARKTRVQDTTHPELKRKV